MHLQSIVDYLKYEACFDENPQHLVDEIKAQASYLSEEQKNGIQKAYEYMRDAHKEQKRQSGEPYCVHPLRATQFLMHMKPGCETIQACLLHDVIEDTEKTREDIEKDFGADVALLCEGLVKVSKVRYRGEERQIETLKKTFLAMASDLRVIFVKIADRVHNIQTLSFLPEEEKKQRIADETMKIFVPICKRLGLYHYQLYLENGCFAIQDPQGCLKIIRYMRRYFGRDQKHIDKGVKKLSAILKKEKVIGYEVKGRIKSPYRIHHKMMEKYKGKEISKVMDMVAFRILVGDVGECYNVLGIIHKHFTPLINKIKDYISLPKGNGYKSLHTTIIGMFSFPIEIQIRTQEMDDVAEYGVAAHFEYAKKRSSDQGMSELQSRWMKKLQDLVVSYQSNDDKEGFKKELNIEVLNKSKFLYTPKGDVIEMAEKSSVLDFAFRIHSDVGMHFKSAIVNGGIKPIGYMPKTGDVIEIHTFKNKISATQHWMDFLYTPSAKNKLLRYIKSSQREELLKKSILKLNRRLEKENIPLLYEQDDRISQHIETQELERRLLLMLDKQEPYSHFIKEFYPQVWKRISSPTTLKTTKEILVEKKIIIDENKELNYSLCDMCKPLHSDKIIARSSKDGIKIHNIHCRGMKTVSLKKLLEAHWSGEAITTYQVTLTLMVSNSNEQLVHIISVFSDLHITMDHIDIVNTKKKKSSITITSSHANPARILYLLNSLKKLRPMCTIKKTSIS